VCSKVEVTSSKRDVSARGICLLRSCIHFLPPFVKSRSSLIHHHLRQRQLATYQRTSLCLQTIPRLAGIGTDDAATVLDQFCHNGIYILCLLSAKLQTDLLPSGRLTRRNSSSTRRNTSKRSTHSRLARFHQDAR
jgi:hypothetical protein